MEENKSPSLCRCCTNEDIVADEKNCAMPNVAFDNICSHCGRTRVRDEAELRALKNRLNRIEGQIRGISGMIDSDAYCVDILTQVSAVQAAISSFATLLLSQHIKSCVAQDLKNDKPDTADELAKIVAKLMR